MTGADCLWLGSRAWIPFHSSIRVYLAESALYPVLVTSDIQSETCNYLNYCGRADIKVSSSTRNRYLSPSLFPVLPTQYKQNTKIIIYRPPHPPHPGRTLVGWPAQTGSHTRRMFSCSHLGLIATPRSDPFSTWRDRTSCRRTSATRNRILLPQGCRTWW